MAINIVGMNLDEHGELKERSWKRPWVDDPMVYFPFDTVRPQQEKAIREAYEAYKSGKRFVVLEGPCGSGKSAIIMTLCRAFGSAHIITPLKILQTQYASDFPVESTPMKGKSNYPCAWTIENADAANQKHCGNGPCNRKKGFDGGEICTPRAKIVDDIIRYGDGAVSVITGDHVQFTGCPYLVQKNVAKHSPNIIHNFDGYLYQNMNKEGGWAERPFLAIDEAHNVEMKLISFMSANIPQSSLLGDDVFSGIEHLSEFHSFFTKKVYKYNDMCIYFDHKDKYFVKRTDPSQSRFSRQEFIDAKIGFWKEKGDEKEIRSSEECSDKVGRLIQNATSGIKNAMDYVFEINERGSEIVLTGSPIFAGTFKHALFRDSPFVMLASATILNNNVFCASLGIKQEEVEYIQIESDFPKNNRVLKKDFAGKMSRANKEKTMPFLIKTICKILDEHKNNKGIIHSHSFALTRDITDAIGHRYKKRLLCVDMFDGYDRKEKMLDHHRTSKDPTFIIDPSCDQGVDLPDDLCRFQIMAKVPYPSMGKWMKKRMSLPGGNTWYTMQTALKFVQQYGRGNRHNKDHCEHYLIDRDFEWFMKNCSKSNIIPGWITAAIERKIIVL